LNIFHVGLASLCEGEKVKYVLGEVLCRGEASQVENVAYISNMNKTIGLNDLLKGSLDGGNT
jgi:hypothetical protein